MAEAQEPKVEIRRIHVDEDPGIDLYHVTLTNNSGEWPELWGSEHDLQVYLRGVEAGARMAGAHVTIPPTPR